jgi:ketosteroid isomerase-like protein
MKRLQTVTFFLIALIFISSSALWGEVGSSVHFPQPEKINADKKTVEELKEFYIKLEKALAQEDMDTLMTFYADDYQHHGITKRQLRFMWLEILNNYDHLYSAHIFTKIDLFGKDAVVVCTGGLFGIPKGSKSGDYEAIDSWVNVNHWLNKMNGKWMMVGGGTHSTRGALGLELHPLF